MQLLCGLVNAMDCGCYDVIHRHFNSVARDVLVVNLDIRKCFNHTNFLVPLLDLLRHLLYLLFDLAIGFLDILLEGRDLFDLSFAFFYKLMLK